MSAMMGLNDKEKRMRFKQCKIQLKSFINSLRYDDVMNLDYTMTYKRNPVYSGRITPPTSFTDYGWTLNIDVTTKGKMM